MSSLFLCIHVFFFKQKTAYDMRISDWSSDVCSSDLCEAAGVNSSVKIRDLSEPEVERLRAEVGKYVVEGDLRREIGMAIKRLMDLACYRGLRHRRGLPLRGQRNRTNARTRKGTQNGRASCRERGCQ